MRLNKARIAVAGSGKTELIVQKYRDQAKRTLFVTFTTNGQGELRSRLRSANPRADFEVTGWFTFLAEHFLKPFMYDFSPGRRYSGLAFDWRPAQRASGDSRYFNVNAEVSSHKIAYVARKIAEVNGQQPIHRLERIYERIVFDEAQDLVASDLVILEMLLKSNLDVFMVGDIRQTVFETNTADTKYKEYRKLGKLDWFKKMAKDGLLELDYDFQNRRCHEDIVSISNAVFRQSLGFENAEGMKRANEHHHCGVFRVSESELEAYCEDFKPQGLRYNKRSWKEWENKIRVNNFGEVKGLAFDHVVIFPTPAIRDFLLKDKPFSSDETAAKLYVAITRARHSVCFVLPPGAECGEKLPVKLKEWKSSSNIVV